MGRQINVDDLINDIRKSDALDDMQKRIFECIVNTVPTAELVPQWISVKERPPKESEDVIMCVAYMNEFGEERTKTITGHYYKQTWFENNQWSVIKDKVTHWMPTLKTPQQEEFEQKVRELWLSGEMTTRDIMDALGVNDYFTVWDVVRELQDVSECQ